MKKKIKLEAGYVRSTLKNDGLPCSYLPTNNRPYQKNVCLSEILFFFILFFSNSVNPSLKSLKGLFYLKKGYRDCYYMHSYLIYSICRPLKGIVRRGHKIMLNFKKRKRPTYPN